MRFLTFILLTLFTLTPLIAQAPAAATAPEPGMRAYRNGAAARKATVILNSPMPDTTRSATTAATYTIGGAGGGSAQEISVASGADDAKQRESNTVVTNSWRHPLGFDGAEQL